MSAKFPHSASGHTCDHPDCCPEKAAEPESISWLTPPEVSNPAQAGAAAVPGGFKRWLLWFAAFFGIYASSSVCPFCGTPGCPVGAGGALVVGGAFAALWQYGRNIWGGFKKRVTKPRG
jgi:hypothetical protein